MEITIAIGSTSVHKIKAVEATFIKLFPGTKITSIPYKAASDINAQPIGNEETLMGARNRLNNAKKLIQTKVDYIIAIENGIIEVKTEPSMFYDVAWVVLEDGKSGKQSVAVSGGVQFPNDFVEQAKSKGFVTTTVGSLLAQSNTSIDEADPHNYLTNKLAPRSELLQEAIKIAIGQLQKK